MTFDNFIEFVGVFDVVVGSICFLRGKYDKAACWFLLAVITGK